MTRRIEIAGQMYETSRYVTHAYRTLLDDPVALMSRRPIVVVLLHQDSFLIEPMLKEIANIFERAMKWSKQDLKVLQDDVALITYLFSHAMPTTRGSAAISEWIETSLYRYHGYRLAYTDTEKRMVNLEALVSSFEEFRGAYDSLISLTPIDTK